MQGKLNPLDARSGKKPASYLQFNTPAEAVPESRSTGGKEVGMAEPAQQESYGIPYTPGGGYADARQTDTRGDSAVNQFFTQTRAPTQVATPPVANRGAARADSMDSASATEIANGERAARVAAALNPWVQGPNQPTDPWQSQIAPSQVAPQYRNGEVLPPLLRANALDAADSAHRALSAQLFDVDPTVIDPLPETVKSELSQPPVNKPWSRGATPDTSPAKAAAYVRNEQKLRAYVAPAVAVAEKAVLGVLSQRDKALAKNASIAMIKTTDDLKEEYPETFRYTYDQAVEYVTTTRPEVLEAAGLTKVAARRQAIYLSELEAAALVEAAQARASGEAASGQWEMRKEMIAAAEKIYTNAMDIAKIEKTSVTDAFVKHQDQRMLYETFMSAALGTQMTFTTISDPKFREKILSIFSGNPLPTPGTSLTVGGAVQPSKETSALTSKYQSYR